MVVSSGDAPVVAELRASSRQAAGTVERRGGSFAVSIDGQTVDVASSRGAAVARLGDEIVNRIGSRAAREWGVLAACAEVPFTFAYGNETALGPSASIVGMPRCVHEYARSIPNRSEGFRASLEHARRVLSDCCR